MILPVQYYRHIRVTNIPSVGHWDLRYCSFDPFFKQYFSNLNFYVLYYVSCSPGVCGFSSFWLMVFSKRTKDPLGYCDTIHLCSSI